MNKTTKTEIQKKITAAMNAAVVKTDTFIDEMIAQHGNKKLLGYIGFANMQAMKGFSTSELGKYLKSKKCATARGSYVSYLHIGKASIKSRHSRQEMEFKEVYIKNLIAELKSQGLIEDYQLMMASRLD